MRKPQPAWGIYNYGRLIGTERTRKEAIREVERFMGEPWRRARKYIQVVKVTIVANAELRGATDD